MCVEGEGGRKRGEAGAHQGSRMGVLIKKTQIAAKQMISSLQTEDCGGWRQGLLEIFASHGAELISLMQVQEEGLKS